MPQGMTQYLPDAGAGNDAVVEPRQSADRHVHPPEPRSLHILPKTQGQLMGSCSHQFLLFMGSSNSEEPRGREAERVLKCNHFRCLHYLSPRVRASAARYLFFDLGQTREPAFLDGSLQFFGRGRRCRSRAKRRGHPPVLALKLTPLDAKPPAAGAERDWSAAPGQDLLYRDEPSGGPEGALHPVILPYCRLPRRFPLMCSTVNRETRSAKRTSEKPSENDAKFDFRPACG